MSEIYVKLLKDDLTHNGYVYKEGLNSLPTDFLPYLNCGGGFYFCKRADVSYWMCLYYYCVQCLKHTKDCWCDDKIYNRSNYKLFDRLRYFSYVILPPDARVIKGPQTFKTDKLILTKIQPIEEFDWNIKDCSVMGSSLRFIAEQTPELCLEAVKQNGAALAHVNAQTPELCLEAVKQNGAALAHVKTQTPELCLEAVKQNGGALKFVKEQTREICLAAIQQNTYAHFFVRISIPSLSFEGRMAHFGKARTKEFWLNEVSYHGLALQFVDAENQTPEICLAAVKQNGLALKYVEKQTHEICLEALKQNYNASWYVKVLLTPSGGAGTCD